MTEARWQHEPVSPVRFRRDFVSADAPQRYPAVLRTLGLGRFADCLVTTIGVSVILVPHYITSRYADVFAEFAEEIAACTQTLFIEFELEPRHAGLRDLLGFAVNEDWHSVRATMGAGKLVELNICFAGAAGSRHEPREPIWSEALFPPVTRAAVESELRHCLTPKCSLAFSSRIIELGEAAPKRKRVWSLPRFETAITHGPVVLSGALNRQLVITGPSTRRSELLGRLVTYFGPIHIETLAHDDWQLRPPEGWMAGSEWRSRRVLEMIVAFCYATELPPYVVLEIINWLPRFYLHSDLRKLRWIEAAQRSIAGVRAAKAAKAAIAAAPTQ
jgi:hypothetical protein